MAYVRIRPRRGNAEEWKTANPVLSQGEFAVEHPDTGPGTGLVNFKIGDGVTPWNSLPYAFQGKTTVQAVADMTEQVADMNEDLEALKTTVSSIQSTLETLRRVDIQGAEPAEPLIGQVWIETDVVTGSLVLNETSTNVIVGDDPVRLTCQNSLSMCDEVLWEISGTSPSPGCISLENVVTTNSGARVDVRANYFGSAVVVAKAYYQGAVLYTASCTFQVIQQGSLRVSPTSLRLFVQKTAVLQLEILDGLPYDVGGIRWMTVAANGTDYVQLSEQADTSCKVTALAAGATVPVYAIARYNNSEIYRVQCSVTTIGAFLSTYSLDIKSGTSTYVNIYSSSMEEGTDYTDINVSVADNSKVELTQVTNGGFRVNAVESGTTYVTVTVTKGDNLVQPAIVLEVRVSGAIELGSTMVDCNVGDTTWISLTNRFAVGTWTRVIWSHNRGDNDVYIEARGGNDNPTGAYVRVNASGNTIVTCTMYNGTENIAEASCVIRAKGAITFPDTVNTQLTKGVGYTINLNSTLTYGVDYDQIVWSPNNASVTIGYANSGLTGTINPTATGSVTIVVQARKANGQIVSEDSLVFSIKEPKVQGTLSITPPTPNIKKANSTTLELQNTYTLYDGTNDGDYDNVVWEVDTSNNLSIYGGEIAEIQSSNPLTCTVYGKNPGTVQVFAKIRLGAVVVDTASVVLTVNGDIKFDSSIVKTVDAGTVLTLYTNSTLVAGTWKTISWTLDKSACAHWTDSNFNSDGKQSSASVTFGPNAGTVRFTVAAVNESGTVISNDYIDIDVLTDVTIDTSNISGDLAVGDGPIQVLATNNLIQGSQYDTYEWTVTGNNSIITLSESSVQRTYITAVGIGVAVLRYAVYDSQGALVKDDEVRVTVQGELTINTPQVTAKNIGEVLDLTATSTLVDAQGRSYNYEWRAITSGVVSIEQQSDPLNVKLTGLAKGQTDIVLDAVFYNGSERSVQYTATALKVTILGDASFDTSEIGSWIDLYRTVNLNITSDVDTDTYRTIEWSVGDASIVTLNVNPSDPTKATITGDAKGQTEVVANFVAGTNTVLKQLTTTVVVNGDITINGGDTSVRMYEMTNLNGTSTLLSESHETFDWVATDPTVVELVNGHGNTSVEVKPLKVGTTTVRFQATTYDNGNKTINYQSDPITVTVEPNIKIDTTNLGDFIDLNATASLGLLNSFDASEYDDIEWTSDNTSVVRLNEIADDDVEAEGVGAGEGVTVTASAVKDGNVIASDSITIDVQGDIVIEVPTIGVSFDSTTSPFDVEATSTLLDYTFDSDNETNGGYVWSSTDNSVLTVAQNSSNFLSATITVAGEGVATIKCTAVDGDENDVAAGELQFTVTTPAPAP